MTTNDQIFKTKTSLDSDADIHKNKILNIG